MCRYFQREDLQKYKLHMMIRLITHKFTAKAITKRLVYCPDCRTHAEVLTKKRLAFVSVKLLIT